MFPAALPLTLPDPNPIQPAILGPDPAQTVILPVAGTVPLVGPPPDKQHISEHHKQRVRAGSASKRVADRLREQAQGGRRELNLEHGCGDGGKGGQREGDG